MYLEHFGLVEAPFRITPHTDFFFTGANRGATLEALVYAIRHDEGIVKVCGEVGSGKTMLCRVLMERLPANVTIVYLANPSLSREDILFAIADEIGLVVPPDARAALVLRALQDHLIAAHGEGRQVVVLIDEAHAMPAETLEEIRLLSNLESNRNKLLQLVLFGQPELNEILSRSDMRQLKERITHNFALEPLVLSDISSYLDFRMRAAGYKGPSLFGPKSVQAIAKASQGLTRRINILADKCLLASYSAGSHQIGTKEFQAAIRDSDFSSAAFARPKREVIKYLRFSAAILAALVLGGWIATIYNQSLEPPKSVAGLSGASANANAPAPPSQITRDQTIASAPATAPHEEVPTLPAPPAIPTGSNKAPPQAETLASNEAKEEGANLGPLSRQRLIAGHEWLATANDEHWFLQLLLSEEERSASVESYLRTAKRAGLDLEKVRIYATDLGKIKRIGVIYGDYESRALASAGLKDLPGLARVGRPYPRQVVQLR